jgi:tetrapyrrole methylase family protein/MazG family protein
MSKNQGITLLGLGPGEADLLTRQAWQLLESIKEIYVRTAQHPAVQGFPKGLQVHSFDELYEQSASFEEVYETIVERVLELGRRPQGVVYGVPGSPYVAEATSPEIARRARQEGLPVRIVEGLSFLEPVFAALDVDPLPQTGVLDALFLGAQYTPPFPPDAPALVAQVHSQAVASNLKLTLMEIYPDEHLVKLVHAAGTPQEVVEDLALYEIDRSKQIGLLTSLYISPLSEGTSMEAFQNQICHLRAPEGCPWDREQTHLSLRQNLLEETYEVLEALDREDPTALREELGDLMLQIVLHAQIANEEGEFNLNQVIQGIYLKILHRHPHVFGEVKVRGAEDVLVNWEKLKAAEREKKGKSEACLLESVSNALPALMQAQTYQDRAARVGFDWKEIRGVQEKLIEEMQELQEAQTDEERASEIGDLLFSTVNLARWYKIDAESALRGTNSRFYQRFCSIEKTARDQGRPLSELSLEEMDALWEEAKSNL